MDDNAVGVGLLHLKTRFITRINTLIMFSAGRPTGNVHMLHTFVDYLRRHVRVWHQCIQDNSL